jgi:cation:H+ antiporter
MLVSLGVILIGFLVMSESAREAVVRLVRVSRHFGVSEFSISFLGVGLVSILPELLIGLNSAADGASSFGLGIVFGSNVADLSLVVGIVALVSGSLSLSRRTLSHLKYVVGLVALPVILLLDGSLSRTDGLLLIGVFVLYALLMLWSHKPERVRKHVYHSDWKRDAVVVVFLVLVMVLAGEMITTMAEQISAALVLPLVLVGAMLAVGTCLPELLFSLRATQSNHVEMGVGDVLGNVVADALLAVGLIAVFSPIHPQYPLQSLALGAWMLLELLLVCGLFWLAGRISRTWGLVLVLLYVAFLVGQFFLDSAIISGTPFFGLS